VMHSKTYDVETFFKRYSIFKTNVDYVNNHNAKNASYEMEMNRFGDLTFEEFSAFQGLKVVASVSNTILASVSEDPVVGGSSLDWRNRNAVNPIRDQGGCGSCWAFSAIAAVEGAWAVKKGSLLKLSEQQLVDCSTKSGCSGGAMPSAFQWIIQNGGIGSLSQYPYAGRDQSCKSGINKVATLSKYTDVRANDEGALMTAANIGVVAIGIAASQSFQFYSKGVLDDGSCGNDINHGVDVVGYGTAASGKDYWIIRNSWGTGWGESGYMRIVRNKNMCGLALWVSYPNV